MKKIFPLVLLGLLTPAFSQAAEPTCAKPLFEGQIKDQVRFSLCLTDNDKLLYSETDLIKKENIISFVTEKKNASFSIKKHPNGEIREINIESDDKVVYTLSSGKSKKGHQVATMEAGNVDGCLDHVDLDPISVKNYVDDSLSDVGIYRLK